MKFVAIILCTVTTLAFASPPRGGGGNSPFEMGKRAYESGKYQRALDLFAQSLGGAGDASTRNKAYYYQGLVLFELGFYYSSYVSFRNVLLTADDSNKEIYEKAIKNAVIITDRLDMVDRVGKALEKLPPSFLPTSVSALTNYAMGMNDFTTGNVAGAMTHLKSVPPESQFYGKALFHLGVIATRQRNYKEAAYYFERILELAHGRAGMFPLAELSRLNLARTMYSAGEIEKSIELYSQFLSSSPHWLTVLLEASWPLLRVNDTTVSLGNLHTVLSPFYRDELVGEAYILRTTILFSLCKYEEMRKTLSQFFAIYDPVLRSMQQEQSSMGGTEAYYRAFTSGKGLNASFINFAKRDEGIKNQLKTIKLLQDERQNLAGYSRNDQTRRLAGIIDDTIANLSGQVGGVLQKMHQRKMAELIEQREQANYLKVEIVTGEKELIEGQKGLPPKRIVDVETSVAAGYRFWPFVGEYWDDELGTYVYTTESACVN